MAKLNHQFVSNRIDEMQLRRWWVAEQLGISRRTLQRWLNGQTSSVQTQHLEQLAELLDCDVQQLVQNGLVATSAEQVSAAKALIASDLLQTMSPGHQFALYAQIARGMAVPGLTKAELGGLYMNLALAEFRLSHLDAAATYAEQTREIALGIDDPLLLLRANMQLSYRQYLQGDAAGALQMDYENLKLAQSLEHLKLTAANLSNIADQLHGFGRLEESAGYQREAIKHYETCEAGVESNLTFCHLGLARLYLEKLDVRGAQNAAGEARTYAEAGQFLRGLADCDRLMALVHKALGNKHLALACCNSSLQRYEELGIREVQNLIDLGLTFLWIEGKTSSGRAMLEDALELALSQHSIILEAQVRTALYQIGHGDWRGHRARARQIFESASLGHQITLMDQFNVS